MNNNIEENIYSLAEKNCTLFSVNIELLTKCNWRCKHCYIPNHDSDGLSKEKVYDIFKQLRDLGTFEIILTGGEIFCRDDIIEIIEKARQMFFRVNLLTNVSLMNESIISRLSKLNLNNISCTLFSLDNEIHDSITQIPGSLNKALKNIRIIKKYNIPLIIKTVLMKQNYDSYKELQSFAKENGFKYVATTLIMPKNNGDNSPIKFRLSKNQLKKVFSDLDNNDKISRHISVDDYVCNTIRYSIVIGYNGNVYPCSTFNESVGNIYESSIKDIWNNSEQLLKIRNIKWNDLTDCKNCNKLNYCYRCPGITLLEEGNLLSKSKLACQNANIRYKLFHKEV